LYRLRATSAAPTYFKSFFHTSTSNKFTDGGIKFNNPVEIADWERKTIWPELKDSDPDILLSIGTGYQETAEVAAAARPSPQKKKSSSAFLGRSKTFEYAKNLAKIAADTLQESMNSEKMWHKFYHSVTRDGDKDRQKKYRRLNPCFADVPDLDMVDRINELEAETRARYFDSPEVASVASTLIASLFYIEEEPLVDYPKPIPQDWEYFTGNGNRSPV
jgi:hypothetical protein